MAEFMRRGLGLITLATILPMALPAPALARADLKPVINSVSPNPATANSSVTVRTFLRNQGSTRANLNQRWANGKVIHMVRWYFKENGRGPDRFIMAMSWLGMLNPGQSKTLTPNMKIPADARPGNHVICAEADPENRIRESNERNNRSCFRVRVRGRAMTTLQEGRGAATGRPSPRPGVARKVPGMAPKCSELPAPRHIAPRNGSKFSTFPRTTRFRWSAVNDARSYGIEVDCLHCCVQGKWCSDVGKTWHVKSGLNTTQYVHNFVGAQPGRWRVWAIDACGKKGKVSNWWKFEYTR